MNASTPERLQEALDRVERIAQTESDPETAVSLMLSAVKAVRVEEPAGEPEPAEPMDEYVERVAQSANADVRVGDGTEALRAALNEAYRRVGEADAQRMVALRKNDERVEELEEALARVAGLEAREALLLEELRLREESQIPVVPHAAQEKIERLEVREASLRDALTQAVDCKGWGGGLVSKVGGDPAICMACEKKALAALEAGS